MYDDGYLEKYSFYWDASAGDEQWVVNGPKGKKGRVVDYGVHGVVTTFTNVTTGALISVGKSGDADYFAEEINLAAIAADSGSISARQATSDMEVLYSATYLTGQVIDADQDVYLVAVAPTGGSPAGKGSVFMVICWDK